MLQLVTQFLEGQDQVLEAHWAVATGSQEALQRGAVGGQPVLKGWLDVLGADGCEGGQRTRPGIEKGIVHAAIMVAPAGFWHRPRGGSM
ncbi:MAG: hypothetical protein AMXMBFR45_07080 [Gammaproteobacteria bacterium]|nr:MAG: hypothetical protein BroJett010_22000 [Gammaproteobacteria bacterium]